VDDSVTSAMHSGLSMVRQLRHTCWFTLSSRTGRICKAGFIKQHIDIT